MRKREQKEYKYKTTGQIKIIINNINVSIISVPQGIQSDSVQGIYL
jgi:hypothetical protein